MALMSNLFVGASGIRVHQYALNTTAHNLANVDTEGYTRQQTVLKDFQYQHLGWTHFNTLQSGIGVDTQTVKQVRDIFLDKAFRAESGRKGFYDAQADAIREMEDLFGELQGVAFQDSIEKFWVSLQEIAKEPDSLVTRASFVETAVNFVERAENISNQLRNYQLNLNVQIRDSVNRINQIADRLDVLNDEICFYEANKIERANDYRDERNNLLDELGKMIRITYQESPTGRMSVIAEGIPLVTEDTAFHMSTMTVAERYLYENPEADLGAIPDNKNSQMLIPIWPSYGNDEVFNFARLPNPNHNTDIGSLKGLLLARGSIIANYLDIPTAPNADDYKDSYGDIDVEAYDAAIAEYREAVGAYNHDIEPSIILTAQSQFDRLIHGIVTTINDILCPNKTVTLTGAEAITFKDGTVKEYDPGTKIQILDPVRAGVGMDGPPPAVGEELFSRKSKARYSDPVEITVENEDGSVETLLAYVYEEEDPGDNYTLYTLGEITINQAVLEDKSKIPLSLASGSGDFDIARVEELITAWQSPFSVLTPNTLTMNNFNEYYTSFVAELANRGEQLSKISENQTTLVNSIDNQRKEISGVSSDEELTNIIKFQHGYNAASRYINVVDEMLEHIILRL